MPSNLYHLLYKMYRGHNGWFLYNWFSGRPHESEISEIVLKFPSRSTKYLVLALDALFSSFPLAESPLRDLQITAYK